MDLTQGNIQKQLISMAVPAGIGMLFYTLYNVVDTFYAGLISTEALAGLAISFPVYFILLAFAVGVQVNRSIAHTAGYNRFQIWQGVYYLC